MQVLDPEFLALTRELSPGVSVVAGLVGLALWLFGARSHRFWLSLLMTVSAGMVGLVLGRREFAVQPLVAGLLLALAAGMLALALTRITLFVLGGLCAILVVRIVVPSANEFLCFVVGGLIGICFYQLWITALSSLLGSVLMGYSIVSLLNRPEKFDSVTWATQNAPLINWTLIGCTVLGILTQFILDRRREKNKVLDRDKKVKDKQVVKEKDKELKELKVEKLEKELEPVPWWSPRNFFGDRAA
jgi:hypothetical protein